MHGILSQREVNLDGDEKGEAAAVSAMPSITKIKAITPGTPRAAVRLFFLPSAWRVATLFPLHLTSPHLTSRSPHLTTPGSR
jgi:hypothetical protein